MGCDCRIMLPDNVRVRDVALIVGRAAGLPAEKSFFSSNDGWSTEVPGVETRTASEFSPEMVNIFFDGRRVPFFFEPDRFRGRLLMPTSTVFWALIGHKLVDFYGGKLDYNDCDDVDVDYERRAKSDQMNKPTDGDAWYRFHQRILDLKPIHRDEMENFAGKSKVGWPDDSSSNTYSYDADGYMVRGAALLAAAAAKVAA